MSDQQVKWRIDFARQVAERLAGFEGIRAIVIAGSVARDYADEYSDVEIPIFWEALPDDETRLAIVAALKGSFLYGYNGPAQEDQILINSFQVDLWHISVADEEATLEAVLGGQRSDSGSLNALDTMRSCIPLYGEALVRQWKLRAQEYPDELAQKVIREHLVSFETGQLFMLGQRDNPTAFYAQLSHLQQEIFVVLLALNRSYFPTFKWLYRGLEGLQIKPQAVGERFRRVFEVSYAEATADTKQILEETLRLVDARFPQIDTGSAWQRLSYARAAHEMPLG